jgi:tight adherence protein C
MAIALTSLIASGAVFLFVLWYMRSKSSMESRVRALGEQQRLVVETQEPFTQRVAFPVVDGIVNFLMAILPTALISLARKWLVIAGDKMSLSQFLTLVLVSATAIPGIYFVLMWIATEGSPSLPTIFPIFFLIAIGVGAPFMLLRRAAKNRQSAIWKSLPSALDLMTTCVEAGLSLDFALQRVGERYKGPLSDEINRMLREVGLGKTRRDALVDMAERVDLPDLMTFVNSIVQAETLGTSVGSVLRVQAAQMRMRRRQRAEQVARQAPVKMVFPLVLFLMPSLFIVTIGPVVLNVIKAVED